MSGKYHKSTLKYKLTKTRGNRWGVKEKSTNSRLEINNHFAQAPVEGVDRYCLFCGKVIPFDKYHNKMKNQVCNNICRKNLTAKINKEEKETEDWIKARSKKHKRKCIICGKLCYPNYFFCRAHAHQAQELYDSKEGI